MKQLTRDGVRLAYEERGVGGNALLFIHGLGFDHTTFTPQIAHFERWHRVVAVDLRGHGASDAPRQEYTMQVLAEDVAWLSEQLNIERPVVVGHSMGGNVALTLAALYPDLPSSITLIDSLLFPSLEMRVMLEELGKALERANLGEVRGKVEPLFFLPSDDAAVRGEMTAVFSRASQHVLHSAFVQHTVMYDAATFTAACKVPVAYIGSAKPLADLAALRSAIPEVVIAQTLGSGHFSPVMVPDQINAMIARFITYAAATNSLQPQYNNRSV